MRHGSVTKADLQKILGFAYLNMLYLYKYMQAEFWRVCLFWKSPGGDNSWQGQQVLNKSSLL